MNYYRKRSWQSVLSVTQHFSYCRLLCKYPLKCLVGRLISRRIGFFIQTDWVIKFLVGVSQVMKWEKLFVLSAKKHSDVTTKDSLSYFSMLEAKVTKHWQLKYSVDHKWFFTYSVNRTWQNLWQLDNKHGSCFNC